MTFYFQPSGTVGRTIFETDCLLFSEMFNSKTNLKDVDRRLLIMITTGLLNRSLNLEKYLVAALGQDWTFLKPVQVGQTIHCKYKISLIKEEKKVYQIHIELFADQIIVANGIWTVMFNQFIN